MDTGVFRWPPQVQACVHGTLCNTVACTSGLLCAGPDVTARLEGSLEGRLEGSLFPLESSLPGSPVTGKGFLKSCTLKQISHWMRLEENHEGSLPPVRQGCQDGVREDSNEVACAASLDTFEDNNPISSGCLFLSSIPSQFPPLLPRGPVSSLPITQAL